MRKYLVLQSEIHQMLLNNNIHAFEIMTLVAEIKLLCSLMVVRLIEWDVQME